jgi:hypothetical protein
VSDGFRIFSIAWMRGNPLLHYGPSPDRQCNDVFSRFALDMAHPSHNQS